MFDRFTDRARKVMGLAREEAVAHNHQYIGTEHILMGLINEGSGVAAHTLRNLNVGLLAVQQELDKLSQDGPTMVTMGQLPFTPRCKKVLELSAETAYELHHPYIGTEHLLMGVIREDVGNGAKALKILGLSLQSIRMEVMELLGPVMAQTEIQAELEATAVEDDTISVGFDDYQEFTRSTAVYPGRGVQCFDSAAYCALGLTGEAGEVAEKMKKRFRLGGPEAFLPGSTVLYEKTGASETYEQFVEAVQKELGDVLWYVAGLASELGLKLSEVAHGNIVKLSSRKQRGVLKGEGDDR